jgi:chromosome segregation ATPase
VVVNLVFAILFVGATAAYLGQRERERQRYEDKVSDLSKQLAASQDRASGLEQDKKNLQNALQTESDAKERAETNLKNVQASLDTERQNRLENDLKLAQLANDYQTMKNELQTATKTLDDQRQELLALRDAAQKAKEAEAAAIDKQRAAEQDAAAAQAQWRSTAKRLKEVEAALGRYQSRYPEPGGVAAPASLYGKVTQVGAQHSKVVVSLGEDDGVKKGMEFTVYREVAGGGYVGRIIVEDVDKDLCVARVDRSRQGSLGEVKVGDNVSAAF